MSAPLVILGSNGRAGKRLRTIWPSATENAPVLFQSRTAGPAIHCVAPYSTDLSYLLPSKPSALVVLSGRTTGTAEELERDNVGWAQTGWQLGCELGAHVVVLMSSAAVYGRPRNDQPLTEEDTPHSPSPYGLAKLAMERAARSWPSNGTPKLVVLRSANVVGADMLGQSVSDATIEQPLKLDQFANGLGPRRSYLTAATLASVLHQLSLHQDRLPAFSVFNLSEKGSPIPMCELLRSLEILGKRIPWVWQPASDGALQALALDVSKLAGVLPEAFEGRDVPSAHLLAKDWLASESTCQ